MSVGAYISDIEAIPEPDINDVEAHTVAAEAAYTYQRSDGTFEQAQDAEDAIARCPVLGRLAMQDPEQASILLELAASPPQPAREHPEVSREPKPVAQPVIRQASNPPSSRVQSSRPTNKRLLTHEISLPATEAERAEAIGLIEMRQELLMRDSLEEPRVDETTRIDDISIAPVKVRVDTVKASRPVGSTKPEIIPAHQSSALVSRGTVPPRAKPETQTKVTTRPRKLTLATQTPPLVKLPVSSGTTHLPRSGPKEVLKIPEVSFPKTALTRGLPEWPKKPALLDNVQAEVVTLEAAVPDADFAATQSARRSQLARIESTGLTVDDVVPQILIATSPLGDESENGEQPVSRFAETPMVELLGDTADNFETIQIKAIVEALGTAIDEAQHSLKEASEQEKASIEQDIKVLCAHFFEDLEIEYDDAIIKQFVENLKTPEPLANRDTDKFIIEALNNLGRREHRPSRSKTSLKSLAQLVKEKIQPHLIVGRYALRACAG